MKKTLIIIFCIFANLSCRAQSQEQRLTKYKALIIGTWISQEDSSYKIEFSKNNKTSLDYYGLLLASNNLAAAARASIVTSAPDNIRAISS